MRAGWFQRWLVPTRDRFLGKHALAFEATVAPNNYIYENLSVRKLSRSLRVALSNLVVAALLVAALAAVCGLKAYQKSVAVRRLPGLRHRCTSWCDLHAASIALLHRRLVPFLQQSTSWEMQHATGITETLVSHIFYCIFY